MNISSDIAEFTQDRCAADCIRLEVAPLLGYLIRASAAHELASTFATPADAAHIRETVA